MLRIVPKDKIVRFMNTFIIIIKEITKRGHTLANLDMSQSGGDSIAWASSFPSPWVSRSLLLSVHLWKQLG